MHLLQQEMSRLLPRCTGGSNRGFLLREGERVAPAPIPRQSEADRRHSGSGIGAPGERAALAVQEDLDLYARLQGVHQESRAQGYVELPHMTGLGPLTRRLAGRLSDGSKQKLGRACTRVRAPSLDPYPDSRWFFSPGL